MLGNSVMKERSLKDLFHRVGRMLSDEQELITVAPNIIAHDALDLMKRHNLSQVPILAGNEVLGVFSYRSFAEGILRLSKKEHDPGGLPVEAFCEDLRFAQISDELSALLDEFELMDTVLIGSESRLQGIVTTIDALRYFYEVASAYVMLGEIELAIRELMRSSVDEQQLRECINKCVRKYYEAKSPRVPDSLEEMSLSDYVSILTFKGFWERFKDAFGGVYSVTQTKLERLPALRNNVFHFKRDLTAEEYDILGDVRDWLLKRIRKLEAARKIEQNG